MHIILWRHAEAEPGVVDDARELTRKGRKQAKRVAAWLKKNGPARTRVLASSARRAQQTAKALTSRFEITPKVGVDATARELLAAAGWPRSEEAVIVVGHQPEIGRAAALALTGRAADWDIKKGALWWIERRKAGKGGIVRAVISPDFL